MGEEEVVVIGEGIQWNTVDSKLEIGRCQPEGEPGVVSIGKGLVELQGESLKEGRVEGSWNSRVSGYEGGGAFVIDEGPEGTGRLKFASRRTEAARSGRRIRIRASSGWGT